MLSFLEWLYGLDPTQAFTVIFGPTGIIAGLGGFLLSKIMGKRESDEAATASPEEQEQALANVRASSLDQYTLNILRDTLSTAVEAKKQATEAQKTADRALHENRIYRAWIDDVVERWPIVRLSETAPAKPNTGF